MIAYWYGLVAPRRLRQIARARNCDVIFLQRGLLHPKSNPMMERLLARVGPPLVYHLDDAQWVLKPRRYRRRVRLADLVVTGSSAVAEYAGRLGADVRKVEYGVEVDLYPVRRHRPTEPTVIGWTGTRPDEYLTPEVLEGVAEACRRTGARFRVVGGRSRPALGALERYSEWRPWDPENKHSALAGVDIGIVPLSDTEFHRGKEPFKLKEYLAYGLPVVASPYGHNPSVMESGRHGLFARTQEEWTSSLVELIEAPERRAEMGEAGRRLIERRYDTKAQIELLVELLREASGKPLRGGAQ